LLTFQKQLIPFWPEMKQLNRNKTKEIVAKSKKVKSLIRGTADVVNQLFIPDFFSFCIFWPQTESERDKLPPSFVRFSYS
jgi:hypothetical protein